MINAAEKSGDELLKIRIANVKADLVKVCKKHQIVIAPSAYDFIVIWAGDEELFKAMSFTPDGEAT